MIRGALRNRSRSLSLNPVAPPVGSPDYLPEIANIAKNILYLSPKLSPAGNEIFILNAAALPDEFEVDYDSLLPYVLARLPSEEQLVKGQQYEIVFFSESYVEGATTNAEKQSRPGWPWFIQAYRILSRAMRKRIQKLYIVHEKQWVKMLIQMLSSAVSPKFRRKIVHAATLSALAQHLPIQDLLIPPSAYLQDRKVTPHITIPTSGPRAYGAKHPLPWNIDGGTRLPRVLRETTSFLLLPSNVQTEGLFRVPPNVRMKEVLREAYDRGQNYIIWREGDTMLPLPQSLLTPDLPKILNDLDPADTYGVHLAAGVCKIWYSELRQPLIPSTAYRHLREIMAPVDGELSVDALYELISPDAEWSCLPEISRQILIRHLLPMLSEIETHSESNKMSADNLATCFAPSLLRGEDPIEDARVGIVVRKILSAAITQWNQGLRERCGLSIDAFLVDLRPPRRPEEYEDPFHIDDLETEPHSPSLMNEQMSGIVLKDNDIDDEMSPPPLPPRNSTQLSVDTAITYSSSGSSFTPDLPPRRAGSELSSLHTDISTRRKPISTDISAPASIAGREVFESPVSAATPISSVVEQFSGPAATKRKPVTAHALVDSSSS